MGLPSESTTTGSHTAAGLILVGGIEVAATVGTPFWRVSPGYGTSFFVAELPADDKRLAAVTDDPDYLPAVSPAECLGRFAAEAEHFLIGLAAAKGDHRRVLPGNPGILFRQDRH